MLNLFNTHKPAFKNARIVERGVMVSLGVDDTSLLSLFVMVLLNRLVDDLFTELDTLPEEIG